MYGCVCIRKMEKRELKVVTRDASRFSRHASRVTRHVFPVTRHASRVTLFNINFAPEILSEHEKIGSIKKISQNILVGFWRGCDFCISFFYSDF